MARGPRGAKCCGPSSVLRAVSSAMRGMKTVRSPILAFAFLPVWRGEISPGLIVGPSAGMPEMGSARRRAQTVSIAHLSMRPVMRARRWRRGIVWVARRGYVERRRHLPPKRNISACRATRPHARRRIPDRPLQLPRPRQRSAFPTMGSLTRGACYRAPPGSQMRIADHA